MCGKVGPLTYEHVPPRKAFNQHRAFVYLGKELFKKENDFPWDFSNQKATQKQRGTGWHTLCGKCNNHTGAWYGGAFVDFIYQGYREIEHQKALGPLINRNWINLYFREIYPLQVIKQVLTMFCSVNATNFTDIYDNIRELILIKNKRGMDSKRFGIFLYVVQGSISRFIGLAGVLNLNPGQVKNRFVSELSAPPFGYVLEIDPKESSKYCDLTFFANQYEVDQKISICLRVPVYENNTPYPVDYRSKVEVIKTRLENTSSLGKKR